MRYKIPKFLGLFLIFISVANAAEIKSDPTYRRVIEKVDGQNYYVVGPRAPHLFMIGRDLYGDEKSWGEIAHWNKLKPPYALELGQWLLLKKPPTNSEKQGNLALIRAWSNMGKIDIVENIGHSQNEEVDNQPLLPSSTAETKPELNSESSPAPVLEPEPLVEVIPSAKPNEVVASLAPDEDRLSFGASTVGSVSRMETHNLNTDVDEVLLTKFDYGADIDMGYRLHRHSRLLLNVAIDHLDVKKPKDGSEVEGESQNLWHFGVGYEFGAKAVKLVVSGIYDQEVFGRSNNSGVQAVAIYIPQIAIGVRFGLIHDLHFETTFAIDALALAPTKRDEFNFKTGYGGIAGFNFENRLQYGAIIYGISGRFLEQDGSSIKTNQRAGFVKLGYDW